jgi:hypothetical protein
MFHGAIIVRPTESGTFLYRDRDHQQVCIRRVALQEPQAKIFAFSSTVAPVNAIECFRRIKRS